MASSACPLVGLSTSELHVPARVRRLQQKDPTQRDLALAMDYPRSLVEAGGVPVVLPPLNATDVDALMDRLDGLCLSGGPDVDPATYGAKPHEQLGPTEPDVDRFELALLRRAAERELPVLCLCRGAQMLNVSRGGTLLQDLPTERPSHVEHRQEQPGTLPTHHVRVEEGSALAAALEATEVEVNSFHHQAIDRLGDGLRATAWADDGVIEGLEAVDGPFALGVQWHAESLRELDHQRAMFGAFVAACAARSVAVP